MDKAELVELFMMRMQQLQRIKQNNKLSETPHGENLIMHFIKIQQESDDVIPSDISNKMGFSSARIAAILNSLESKGFITRKIDKQDRRKIIIALTKEGLNHEEELATKRREFISNLITQLGEQDTLEYLRLIEKIAQIISDIKI